MEKREESFCVTLMTYFTHIEGDGRMAGENLFKKVLEKNYGHLYSLISEKCHLFKVSMPGMPSN